MRFPSRRDFPPREPSHRLTRAQLCIVKVRGVGEVGLVSPSVSQLGRFGDALRHSPPPTLKAAAPPPSLPPQIRKGQYDKVESIVTTDWNKDKLLNRPIYMHEEGTCNYM
jgi:hypothetical protein